MGIEFKDHFSGHSRRYSRYRPTYPDELYDAVCSHVRHFNLAWDCATGNGQVAVHLAERFSQVIASDASANQISHAIPHERVEYHVCKAEHTGFEDACFDLVTVGQAMHWFDFDAFFSELRRVTRPGGIFACWTYRFLTIDRELDAVLRKFFDHIESYWPAERDHVEALYTTIPFPEDLAEQEMEEIHIERDMYADDVLHYLRTWSSVKNYKLEHGGEDPVTLIENEFKECWGDAGSVRLVTHPMVTRLFVVNAGSGHLHAGGF
jgi:SAM-dependent methyltransferase